MKTCLCDKCGGDVDLLGDAPINELTVYTPTRDKKKKITGRIYRAWELCDICVQEILGKLPDAKAADDY